MNRGTRILSSTKSNGNISGIFKKNAISALGMTEDLSGKNVFP